MNRVDTVNYLKGESSYGGVIQITQFSEGYPMVVEASSEYFRLMEDCLKDVYEQLQKVKDKLKKAEARLLILEKTDDNSTLIS